MNWEVFGRKWRWPCRGTVSDWPGEPKESHQKNAVGITGVLTESRVRHLPLINLWPYFEVRLFGTILLHAPLHAPSCSPVTRISSCFVLFTCYMHLFVLHSFLQFHARLRARSSSPVRCTSSCPALFSCYMHLLFSPPQLFHIAPVTVFMLHVTVQ